MSFSLHNSEEFNRVRQLEALQSPQQPELPERPKEQLVITKAFTGENQSFIYQFLARTQPQDLPKHEISFQKNFLVQHIKTLDDILQNSEESLSKYGNRFTMPLSEDHNPINLSPIYKISLLSFLEKHKLSAQLTDTDQLVKDLEKQKDLSQLISYFINNFSEEVSTQLIVLTDDIWSTVRHLNFRELEIQDIQRIARQWVRLNSKKYLQRADSQAFLSIFKFSKSTLSQNSADQYFANRLIVFAATILFVVSGFFQNPYAGGEFPIQLLSQVDYPKRYSPCLSFGFWSGSQLFSDEEQEGEAQKKHKRQ